ncbi:hypothetical protein CYG49_00620 [Candidatus Saccharibacteria bacterium]|nr:MAG: hypothetical protein CYG49_00620 [Candidatus Saccharibacteria bacterium]
MGGETNGMKVKIKRAHVLLIAVAVCAIIAVVIIFTLTQKDMRQTPGETTTSEEQKTNDEDSVPSIDGAEDLDAVNKTLDEIDIEGGVNDEFDQATDF